MIAYRETKDFTAEELQKLFLSVDWLSGNYPERLQRALKNSSTVISAWRDGELIGLVNAIDDGELTAYAHYLLVNPKFHGMGIGKELGNRLKEKYKEYLYLILLVEDKKNVAFYEKLGFESVTSATPMQILNIPR